MAILPKSGVNGDEIGAQPVATAQRGQASDLRIGIVLRVADLKRWAKKDRSDRSPKDRC